MQYIFQEDVQEDILCALLLPTNTTAASLQMTTYQENRTGHFLSAGVVTQICFLEILLCQTCEGWLGTLQNLFSGTLISFFSVYTRLVSAQLGIIWGYSFFMMVILSFKLGCLSYRPCPLVLIRLHLETLKHSHTAVHS